MYRNVKLQKLSLLYKMAGNLLCLSRPISIFFFFFFSFFFFVVVICDRICAGICVRGPCAELEAGEVEDQWNYF